jgi:acyl-coenzyme A thioesterase PaaI-like protein
MSLTDTVGSLAVATRGQYMTGVSVAINTTFVKPAGKIGSELRARGIVTSMGTLFALLFVSDLTGGQVSRSRTRASSSSI